MKDDPDLKAVFSEYMTVAQNEMLKYSVPVSPGREKTQKQIDSFLELSGAFVKSSRDNGEDADPGAWFKF